MSFGDETCSRCGVTNSMVARKNPSSPWLCVLCAGRRPRPARRYRESWEANERAISDATGTPLPKGVSP